MMKWGASFLRLALAKARLRKLLKVDLGKKPAYLGRGVRLMAKPSGVIHLGCGAYIDDYSRLQASEGATLHVGEYVYMNTNCRVVAAESVEIGAHTMFGPNVCVYDHDHAFDGQGVHGEVKASPVRTGERCWVAANSLVTRGVEIADKILIGGGSVVTASLAEPGVYAGAPARLVRPIGEDGACDASLPPKDQAGNHPPQVPKPGLAAGDPEMAPQGA